MAVVGHLAFVADSGGGLQLLDVSNPAAPAPLGGYVTAGTSYGVAVSGHLALLADGAKGLTVVQPFQGASAVTTQDGLTFSANVTGLAGGPAMVRVGPTIASPNGATMDQNADGVGGQDPDDVYSFTFTVDITPPAAPADLAFADDTGPADGVTADTDLAFSWTPCPDPSGIARYEYRWDSDGPWIATIGPIAQVAAQEGAHTFYVRAVDGVGNVGAYASLGVTVDVTAPPAPAIRMDGAVARWNAVQDTGGIWKYEYQLDGGNWTATTATALATGWAEGTVHGLALRAFDRAGNVSGQAAGTFTISFDGPQVVGTQVADPDQGLVDVTFDKPIDPATFTAADVTWAGYAAWGAGALATGGEANDVYVSGTTAYVADGLYGLAILNVSNPAAPSLTGRFDTPGLAKAVVLVGTNAVVADGQGGLRIISVATPSAPTQTSYILTPGCAEDVQVVGSYAYVADGDAGLRIIDLTDLTRPVERTFYDTPGYAYGVRVVGTLVYVADGEAGLEIFDIANQVNPTPVLKGSCHTPGVARDVQVVGGVAYVADGDAGLETISVSNPAAPVCLGGCATGGYASGLAVSGTVAYVASGQAGLATVNVANSAAPVKTGGMDTPGTAQTLYLSGTTAYLADGAAGLRVLNVSTPSAPTLTGLYFPAANGIQVVGTVGYLADDVDGLRIVNLSNPAAPTLLGYYDTPGCAKAVYVSGTLAYVADGASGLRVISVSSPSSPGQMGYYDTPGNAQGVYVSGTLAYVADGDSGLRIVNLTNMSLKGFYDTAGNAQGVCLSGTTAYVADGDTGLAIFDVSNAASPVLKAYYDTPGSAVGVQVVGTLAYVADGAAGLEIIDVSNALAPALRGHYDTPGSAVGVQVVGSLAYVADGQGGVQILDVSNPAAPLLVGSYDTLGVANGLSVAGSVVYVADGAGGLRIVKTQSASGPAAQSVTQVNPTTFRVQLAAPPLDGAFYGIQVGPNIADTDGHMMDQDGDGVGGTTAHDGYVFGPSSLNQATGVSLAAKASPDSAIYDGSANGTVDTVDDADNFTIDVPAGQTLTVVVTPAATLAPSVDILGPDLTQVGSAVSSATGQVAILQTAPLAQAGRYTVQLTGAGTMGTYTVRFVLNAAVEAESCAVANNMFASWAQTLDAGIVSFAGGSGPLAPQRGSVLGALAATDLDGDWYRFTLAPGQSAALAATALTGAGVNVELYQDNSTVPTWWPLSRTQQPLIDTVISAQGTTVTRIMWRTNPDKLLLPVGAAVEIPLAGGVFVYGIVAAVNTGPPSATLDRLLLNPDGTAIVGTMVVLASKVAIAAGTLLARGAVSATGGSAIQDFAPPAGGSYCLHVTPRTAGAAVDYSLMVTRNVTVGPGDGDTPASAVDISGTGAALGAAGTGAMDRLFAYDQATNQIVELDRLTGAVLHRLPSPVAGGAAVFGLATTATTLLIGGSNGIVYEINPDSGLLIHTTSYGLPPAGPKNVILLIGEGMGSEHVKAASMYLGRPLCFESLPTQALMTTSCADGISDSAAAATAMATGQKVHGGVLSMALPGDGSNLTTSLEMYQAMGKSTGLITTYLVDDATPAAFAAHAASREDYAAIDDWVRNRTKPDVLLDSTSGKTLAQMTDSALAQIGGDPDGFFLMIDNERIDEYSHGHDIADVVQEVLGFNDAAQEVLNWAAGRSDTLVLVTANYEMGGLQVTDNGPGNLPTARWRADYHTATPVPVYAWGPDSDMVTGTIDNTDIFAITTDSPGGSTARKQTMDPRAMTCRDGQLVLAGQEWPVSPGGLDLSALSVSCWGPNPQTGVLERTAYPLPGRDELPVGIAGRTDHWQVLDRTGNTLVLAMQDSWQDTPPTKDYSDLVLRLDFSTPGGTVTYVSQATGTFQYTLLGPSGQPLLDGMGASHFDYGNSACVGAATWPIFQASAQTGRVAAALCDLPDVRALTASGDVLWALADGTLCRLDRSSSPTVPVAVGQLPQLSQSSGLGIVGHELFVTSPTGIEVYDVATLSHLRTLSPAGTGALSVLGADQDDPGDYYSFSVRAGDSLAISVVASPGGPTGSTPASGPWHEDLYGPGDGLLATSDDGGIQYHATADGTYFLRVHAAPGRAGDYLVRVAGATGGRAAFHVESATLQGGAQNPKVVIEFSNDVLPGTLAASDICIGGVPVSAGALVVEDGDTVSVTLPRQEGAWAVTVAAGTIQDAAGRNIADFAGQVRLDLPHVVARQVFYNDSRADGSYPDLDVRDDAAIAAGLQALLPGQTPGAANFTAFARGINGIMVDISHPAATLTAADFTFKVGNGEQGSAWLDAPAPASVSVRPGQGQGGSSRATIAWADGAIAGCWLQVTVLSDAHGGHAGLAADDVFYFGNLPGDANRDGVVDYLDYSALKQQFGGTVNSPGRMADFDCDGGVGSGDLLALEASFGQSINMAFAPAALPALPAPAPATAPPAEAFSVPLATSLASPPATGVLDVLGCAALLPRAAPLADAWPALSLPPVHLADHVGPVRLPWSSVGQGDRAGQRFADVLQQAATVQPDETSGRQPDTNPWAPRRVVETAVDPRWQRLGPVGLDLLATGK